MQQRIGKFEIIRKLGAGGMGEVFLARDPAIGREVALKTILATGASASDARERFFREARAAGGMNHPHLVTIHEFGEDEGTLFLAMEYVPGEDLSLLLQQRSLSPAEVLEVLAQVCEGLAHAHHAGVLHRDIKPSNIRVSHIGSRLHVKVMDFGIARIAGSDMTGTGTLLGTFGYMAPEYIQSGQPDERADLFAVGVILYEALAGEKPFAGDTSGTVLYRILHETPKPLDLSPLRSISAGITTVLNRALQKNPGHRFQKAEHLAAALRAAKDPRWCGLEDPEATLASPRSSAGNTTLLHPMPEAEASTGGRGRFLAWALGLVAVVGLGGWWALRSKSPAPQRGGGTEGTLVASQATPKAETAPASAAPKALPPSNPVPAQRVAPTSAGPSKPPVATVTTLEGAVGVLYSNPLAALAFLNAEVQKNPADERAQALRVVALYTSGQYAACEEGLRHLRTLGLAPRRLALKYPHFRQMLEQEMEAPKLPTPLKRLEAPLGPGPRPRRFNPAGGSPGTSTAPRLR